MITILDSLVPVITTTKRQSKPESKWLSPEAKKAKQNRRRLEKLWKRTKLETVRTLYRAACRIANRLITASRSEHCTRRITESCRDPRALWKEVKNLLHSAESYKAASTPGLCHKFSDYFTSKILKVKQTVLNLSTQQPADSYLNNFYPTTVSEVSKLLSRLPNKTSPLDYIHTSVLKSCSDAFAPLISHLANLSFAEGTFPSSFKEAQVTPLLKKTGLDGDDPANYRPISNLNTISKVIERLALARLLPHVAASGNFNPLQSAYRKQHSTETALVKILDDLYRIIDEQKVAVLIGLDLSAAFDTIDHDTLINRLQSVFGVTGVALKWIEAYLRGRSQYVKIGSERSLTTPCDVGVPQGSVLGPFLFSIYTSLPYRTSSHRLGFNT